MRSSISSSNEPGPTVARNRARVPAYALLCVATFFVADRVLAFVLWSEVIQSGFRYSVLYRGPVNADILILGNSRGMSLVDWPYLETSTHRKAFNLSFNDLPSTLARTLFEDYLDRNRRPDIVVLELSSALGRNSLLGELKLYARASPRLERMIGTSYPEMAWGLRISKLFAFNGELMLRALYYRNRSDHDWLVDGNLTPELIDLTNREPAVRWDGPTAENRAAVVEIVRLAKARGTQVRVIVAPYLPAFVRRSPNAADIYRQMAAGLGTPVLDYSQAIADTALFADRYHMNREGSRVFTDRLIADGVFADRKP